ncbi:MAG: hypothetical protein ACREF3_08450 [Acetobacteraceae bacterium]
MTCCDWINDADRGAPSVPRFLAADQPAWADFTAWLRTDQPRAAMTIARGSSDHAASYRGYLIMAASV